MRYAFDGIFKPVRPVVHRIDVPFASGAMVRRVHDPIHDRIAEVQVRAGHIDFGSQDHLPVLDLAVFHLCK